MSPKARPSGSIIERENGKRYLVRWFTGLDASGKRIYASKTIYGDRKAAKMFLAAQVAGGLDADLWTRFFAWAQKPGSLQRLRQFLSDVDPDGGVE